MRWLLIASLTLGAAIAVSPASAAKLADPCVLISTTDASTALGGTPPKTKAKAVTGGSLSCTYTVKKKSMTVVTTHVATKTAFVKLAKKNPGLVFPISGVGTDAFSALNGTKLLVWQAGTQIAITFVGGAPVVATQQALAKTAVGRL